MILERNVSYTLLLVLIFFIAGFFLRDFTFGSPPSELLSYRITTEYFGASAEEVERIITIPMENNLGDLPGIIRIQSSSEFSKSIISLQAERTANKDILFTDIRERVERSRIQFPKAVQKSRITSSDATNNPVFIVSFKPGMLGLAEFGDYAEREIKTRYQRIQGTGEIELGGRGIKETILSLDEAKAAQYKTDTLSLSRLLNNTIVRTPAGEMTVNNRKVPVLFDANVHTLDDYRNMSITVSDGTLITLSDIAKVSQRYRQPDQISRVNGEQRIILYIHAAGDTNPLILCRDLRRATEKLESEGFLPEIVYNKGQELEEGIRKILVSMMISMAAIFLFIGLFLPGITIGSVFAFSIPASLFLGVAGLSAMTIPVDTGIISGLIIGSGLIVDNYLVVYNHLQTEKNKPLKVLFSPILAATATTIIAFSPLIVGHAVDSQIKSIAVSISILLLVSLFLSFTFLKKPLERAITASITRKSVFGIKTISRPFFYLKEYATRKFRSATLVYVLIVFASIVLLVFFEKEFSPAENPGILFTHVEFPSGTTVKEIDTQLAPYISVLKQIPHVKTVESNARRGNAQISITFSPDHTSASELATTVRLLTETSAKGQFFVGTDQNLDNYKITMTITGPDHETLKEEITRIGKEFSSLPWVSGVIYHFKEEPPSLVFSPHRNRFFLQKQYPDKYAQILRWNIQKPVSLKWLTDGKEQDVRISGSAKCGDLYEIGSIPVATSQGGTIRIGDAGNLAIRKYPDKLYRNNRQNSLSFSVITQRTGLQSIRTNIEKATENTILPKGYGIFTDPAIRDTIQKYRNMALVLCTAIILIYALLAIQSESFTRPLLIISVIPFSAFPPLLVLFLAQMPITASVLVGITVLSGMSVNNYILILDAMDKEPAENPLPERIAAAIEKRFMPLFLSSGTSILASVPILFTSAPFASTPNTLAIIVSLGLLASFIGSFMFLPALLVATRR